MVTEWKKNRLRISLKYQDKILELAKTILTFLSGEAWSQNTKAARGKVES